MNPDNPRPAEDPYCTPPGGFRREASSSSATDWDDDGAGAGEPSPTRALRDAMGHFSELSEYVSHYIAAKFDGLKLSVRSAGVYAALGVVGAIALAALVVSGVVLLCWGAAGGIGAIFGIPWLGALIVGLLVLGMIALGAWLGMRHLTGSWRQQTIHKYEERQRQQMQRFGHNAEERAHAGAEHQ